MSPQELQAITGLLNAHLETINIAIYVVGGSVTVLALLAAYFSIKAAIHIKGEAE